MSLAVSASESGVCTEDIISGKVINHSQLNTNWTIHHRHFNELEHELVVRLSRAYKPATYYMDIFVSPLATVLARNMAFISGSILAVLLILTVWDEDVLNVEHVSAVRLHFSLHQNLCL